MLFCNYVEANIWLSVGATNILLVETKSEVYAKYLSNNSPLILVLKEPELTANYTQAIWRTCRNIPVDVDKSNKICTRKLKDWTVPLRSLYVDMCICIDLTPRLRDSIPHETPWIKRYYLTGVKPARLSSSFAETVTSTQSCGVMSERTNHYTSIQSL